VSDQEVENADPSPGEAPPSEALAESGSRAAAPRGASPVPGWLALLLTVSLVVALGGAAAWLWPQMQQTRESLQRRIAAVEATTGAEQAELRDLREQITTEFDAALAAQASALRAETQQLTQTLADIEQQLARQGEELAQQRQALARQREAMARFDANDRASWLLAEAEYLLRLANQRLIMAGDTDAASALLRSADAVLRELDDGLLHDARAAIAADLAALRAVPTIDVEGLYLRLSALTEQADRLAVFRLAEREEQPRSTGGENWRERLREGYRAALRKLSDYIVIRRRDVPAQALMDPQWEGLVRQNMRMLLEQAQAALLSGNGELYRQSLQRARSWVEQFMESDQAAARAMAREIDQLAARRVAVELPDVSRSLQALDAAMVERRQRRERSE